MSNNAQQFSVGSNDTTLEMKVANMTFMLERLAQDCAPLQFVRELTQNAIDSIVAIGGQHGEIRWDVDWNRRELEPEQGFKLAIIDTGIGMTGPELVGFINQLSSSMHEQSKHGNFGMGAKIAAAPRNPEGLVYLSWKDGRGSMIHLWKDPDTQTYGLRRFNNSEFWQPITDEIKPEAIKDHGTMVVLLGKTYDDDTMQAPPEAQIPSRWILRYLNGRYFKFPESVVVKARENWTQPRDKKHNMLRRVTGQEAYLKSNSASSGKVQLQSATAHWWILKDEVDTSGHHFASGHVAALFNDELYETVISSAGVARLQSFGVIFGYNRVVIYVEPSQDGSLTANTARTQLLIDGQSLPWTDYAVQFRENMPEEITKLMEKVAAGAGDNENASSIRERLKQIKELFKFSRYRPATDGKHMIDDELNAGGKASSNRNGTGNSGGGGSSRSGKGGGRAGDIYSLFAGTGDTPADEIGGFTDPIVKWVSILDGTRTKEILEDRAAKYLPQANMIQANGDFRVFADMIERWKKFYGHAPSASPVVESVVKEWFQQQLVETVLGALALRRAGNWSEQEIEKLWSDESLTSAVLPRYHVDQSIKRALGSKLGTLKDKDVA